MMPPSHIPPMSDRRFVRWNPPSAIALEQVFICPQLHSMFCVIYQLCRVRGAKAIVRLMPHEAAELEPVIHALQAQVRRSFPGSDGTIVDGQRSHIRGCCAQDSALCHPSRSYRSGALLLALACTGSAFGQVEKHCQIGGQGSRLIHGQIDAVDIIKIFGTKKNGVSSLHEEHLV